MKKSILNSKLAYWVKGIYQVGIDKHEKLTVNSAMDTEGFAEQIVNVPPKSVHRIAFIIQGIAKFSGGITSILRLGTYLEEYGHSVSYLDFTNQSMNELNSNATFNLSNYKGSIKNYYKADKEGYDVVIATSWESFYRLNMFKILSRTLADLMKSFCLQKRHTNWGRILLALGHGILR